MARYEVLRAWHGVKVGDVVETENLHPALRPNVRMLSGDVARLTPATPSAVAGAPGKGQVIKRLKELCVKFDGRSGLDDLQSLLPDGDPLKTSAE